MKPIIIISSIFFLCWYAFVGQLEAFAAVCNQEDVVSVTQFGNRIISGRSINNMLEVEESSARYLRLHLAIASGTKEGYFVIRDRDKR
jgi:hypothetical protein